MSKTISINAGSSSLKWQLYLMPEEKVLAKGAGTDWSQGFYFNSEV